MTKGEGFRKRRFDNVELEVYSQLAAGTDAILQRKAYRKRMHDVQGTLDEAVAQQQSSVSVNLFRTEKRKDVKVEIPRKFYVFILLGRPNAKSCQNKTAYFQCGF